MEEHIIFNTEDFEQNKIYGILSYFGILFIVPLIAAKGSQYAKFHANQGLLLFITNLILQVFGRVLTFVLNIATFGLLYDVLSALVSLLIAAIVITFMVIGIKNAVSGEPNTLPIIGNYSLLK